MSDNLTNNKFSNFNSLNNYVLKNFERLKSLNEKCSDLESLFLSKIISRINEKITVLEESLHGSFENDNFECNDEDKLKSIEAALQDLEEEFESIEQKTETSDFDFTDKINKKIEENYKILDEIEKLSINKIFNKINNHLMNNPDSAIKLNGFPNESAEKNESWLESDWNNFVTNKDPGNSKNLTDYFRKDDINIKLEEIDKRIKSIKTKREDNIKIDIEKRKDDLLKKLFLTEKKISELKFSLSR